MEKNLWGVINTPDAALSIIKTATNGFMVAGFAKSTDGDVTDNHGATYTSDAWLLRIDENGNIIWKKCFGGTGNERAESIVQTADYGFIVAGSASSNNGNLTGNNGGTDGWIFKTDSSGNLLWQKNAGSLFDDSFRKIIAGKDNSFFLVGNADSTDLITNGNKPLQNLWVMKIDAVGNPIWSKAFGGIGYTSEGGHDIDLMLNNTLLVTGYTFSNNGDASGNNGGSDLWLLNLSNDGNIIWQKCVGTSKNEFGFAGAYLGENEFAVAGYADSLNGIYGAGYLVKLGSTNIIKGFTYYDLNSNGIKDGSDIFFDNAIIKSEKNSQIISTQPTKGYFQLNTDTGSYTTTVQLQNPYYTTVPSSRTSTFSTYFNVDSFSFAIQPIAGKEDLSVNLVPVTVARPGFNASYLLTYKNTGTTTIANGTVKFIKDSRTSFVYALPSPATNIADTLTWNYSNLKPLDTASILINLNVAPPPIAKINDTLKLTATILPVQNDLTPSNDTSKLKQIVIGSYDPNDKQENYGGAMPVADVNNGSYINYFIRFQNTGNDTAFVVRVADTLDANLDWSSLQMIGSSHACNLSIKDGNKLMWTFDNIKLVDSFKNELLSHGFIAFKIKPKNTLATNSQIKNSAAIYFDYNLPVITNTTVTTIVDNPVITAVNTINRGDIKLMLAPNPAKNYASVFVSGHLAGKFELTLADNNGRILYSTFFTKTNNGSLSVPVNLQHLKAGIYYISVKQKQTNWTEKIIVQ